MVLRVRQAGSAAAAVGGNDDEYDVDKVDDVDDGSWVKTECSRSSTSSTMNMSVVMLFVRVHVW
jgi:hypothetical protein